MNGNFEWVTAEAHLGACRGAEADMAAPIRPVARPLSDEVYLMVRDQYYSRGAKGRHGAWPPNKRSTIDRYTSINRRGFKVLNEPMRRTNALFISEATRGGPHGIYDVQDDLLTMGTDLDYGMIHQRKDRRQYDPTDAHIARFARIVKQGQRRKFEDRGFDYIDRSTGDLPF